MMTFAQIVSTKILPIGDAIIGLLYAIAFIFFLIGMVKFFFTQGEEGREKGKQFAFWGLIGLVVLFASWGLVRILITILTEVSA